MQSSDDVSCSDCKLEIIQRAWTEILLKWFNPLFSQLNRCVNTNKEIKLLTPTCLADIINKYKGDICENDIDRAILCTDDIEPFIKYKYPILRLRYLAEASDYEKKQYIMTSVLLFHCCIRSQSGFVHADICKEMSKYEQEVILKFCERLDDMEITINNVDCAIKEAFDYIKYVQNIPKNPDSSSSYAGQVSTDESDKLDEVSSNLQEPSSYNSSVTVLPSVVTDTSTYSDLATESEISALNKHVFSDSDDVIVYPVNHPGRNASQKNYLKKYAESKHKMGARINVEINQAPYNCGGSCCQKKSYYECEPSDPDTEFIDNRRAPNVIKEPQYQPHKNEELAIQKSDDTAEYEDYHNYNTDSDEPYLDDKCTDNTKHIAKARPLVDNKHATDRHNIGTKHFNDDREFNRDKQCDDPREFNRTKQHDDPREFNRTKQFNDDRECIRDNKYDDPREFNRAKHNDDPREFNRAKHCDDPREFNRAKHYDDPREFNRAKQCDDPREFNDTETKNNADTKHHVGKKQFAETKHYVDDSCRLRPLLYGEDLRRDGFCKPCCGPNEDLKYEEICKPCCGPKEDEKSRNLDRANLKSNKKAEIENSDDRAQWIQGVEEIKTGGKSGYHERVSLKSKKKAEVDLSDDKPQQIEVEEEQKSDGKSGYHERVSLKSKKKAEADNCDDQSQRIQGAEETKTDGKSGYHERVSLKSKKKAEADNSDDQSQRIQGAEETKTDGKSGYHERVSLKSKKTAEADKSDDQSQRIQGAEETKTDGKSGYHERVSLKSKKTAEADKSDDQSQRIQAAEEKKSDGKSGYHERVSLKSKKKAEVDKSDEEPHRNQEADELKPHLGTADYCKPCCGPKQDGKSGYHERISLKSKKKAEVDISDEEPQRNQEADELKKHFETADFCKPCCGTKQDGKSGYHERISLKSKKKAEVDISDEEPHRNQEADELKKHFGTADFCKPCCGPKQGVKPGYNDDSGDQPQHKKGDKEHKIDCLCEPQDRTKKEDDTPGGAGGRGAGEDGFIKPLLCNKAKCLKEMLIKKKWIVIAVALVLLILILLACILPVVLTRKESTNEKKEQVINDEEKELLALTPPNRTERFSKYTNFRIFHEIQIFICVNRICKKVFEQVTNQAYSSLSRCSLICMGPQLWPYPIGYTSFSNKIVGIATDKLEYKFQSIPSEAVNQYLAEAFKLFIGDLAKLERINDQDEKNLTESDDMRVRKMSIQIDVESDPEPRLRINTDESYNLKSETVNNILVIKISSASFCGVQHGLQTLRQLILLDQSSGKLITLSSAVIKDSPSYRYRGLMIDTARNYIPVADLMRTVDAMATVKLNTFHWRISDVTSFPLYLETVPELFEYGAYDRSMIYTKEDVKYLVNRAAVRGIRVVMEVAAPGPVGRAWSWHPEVSCPTKTANYTCSNHLCLRLQLHDSIMDVLQTIYAEILEMTKVDDIFHLSDGVFSMTNCYYLIEERHGFLDKALERLKRANKGFMPKLPIIWHTAHLLGDFEAKTWEQYGVQLADMPSDPADNVLSKYRVIHSSKWDLSCEMKKNRCTKYRTWQEMYSWKSWRNIESFTVEGGEAVLWTDMVNSGNLDSHIWPRAASVAERLWSDLLANTSSSAHLYIRLDNQRWRMLLYGVKVQPVWPLWCSLNPSECLIKVR